MKKTITIDDQIEEAVSNLKRAQSTLFAVLNPLRDALKAAIEAEETNGNAVRVKLLNTAWSIHDRAQKMRDHAADLSSNQEEVMTQLARAIAAGSEAEISRLSDRHTALQSEIDSLHSQADKLDRMPTDLPADVLEKSDADYQAMRDASAAFDEAVHKISEALQLAGYDKTIMEVNKPSIPYNCANGVLHDLIAKGFTQEQLANYDAEEKAKAAARRAAWEEQQRRFAEEEAERQAAEAERLANRPEYCTEQTPEGTFRSRLNRETGKYERVRRIN